LTPIYHPSLKDDKPAGPQDEDVNLQSDLPESSSPEDHVPSLVVVEDPEVDEALATQEVDTNSDLAFVITEDDPVLNIPEPAAVFEAIDTKPSYILRHSANDNPADPERDVYHILAADLSHPICGYFQHSVLGEDFGESTFPRISYVAVDALPYRVHYAQDDNLRFESYKWPFAACNRACEMQALKIRALFDWELDPVNEDSGLDQETKEALMLAREICQWKNVHHHFALNDCPALRKREVDVPTEETVSEADATTAEAEIQHSQLPVGSHSHVLFVSDAARSAIQEIRNIFLSTKGPSDLANMFKTVIAACQIHKYTDKPMQELTLSSTGEMVQRAMAQIEDVFAQTGGKIDAWETRDAIVRATQIYRYQEETSP
jgi:hypothetical protein